MAANHVEHSRDWSKIKSLLELSTRAPSDSQKFYSLEQQKEAERSAKQREKMTQDILGTFAKSAARSLGGSTGQKIVRGLLGSLFGKK